MKKLYVFGDSYVAPNRNSTEWTSLLANKLGVEYENFGVDGSSSEHAIRMFHRTVFSQSLKDSVIVVLLSTVGRLDLEFQMERPETASGYLSARLITAEPKHEWYRENKKYIEWYSVNYNYRGAEINRECYIHALKNFAESESSNIVIVLQNSLQSGYRDSQLPMGVVPKNFMIPEIDIDLLSKNEMIDVKTYNEFTKHTGWDPRINHLTNPNLEIMAESLERMIVTRDVTKMSYDNFKKNVIKQIKSQQQLDEYIQTGILHPNVVREVK